MDPSVRRQLLDRLAEDIDGWSGDDRSFSDIVRNAVDIAADPQGFLYRLCGKFEVKVEEIVDWSAGKRTPGFSRQMDVLEEIKEWLKTQ